MWEIESLILWSEGMKLFRNYFEPGLNALIKDGALSSYNSVQTGPNTGLNILVFDTKTKMNKVIKAMNAARGDIVKAGGMRSFVYTGQVKASG